MSGNFHRRNWKDKGDRRDRTRDRDPGPGARSDTVSSKRVKSDQEIGNEKIGPDHSEGPANGHEGKGRGVSNGRSDGSSNVLAKILGSGEKPGRNGDRDGHRETIRSQEGNIGDRSREEERERTAGVNGREGDREDRKRVRNDDRWPRDDKKPRRDINALFDSKHEMSFKNRIVDGVAQRVGSGRRPSLSVSQAEEFARAEAARRGGGGGGGAASVPRAPRGPHHDDRRDERFGHKGQNRQLDRREPLPVTPRRQEGDRVAKDGGRNKNRGKDKEKSRGNAGAKNKSSARDEPPILALPAPVVTMRTASVYERVVQVGEGTFGKVYKARNADTGQVAALKRLRMESERDGMPITAVREIKLLQALRHPAIVSLREMIVEKGYIYMAFEYIDHDLSGLFAHPTLQLDQSHVKHLFRQITDGVAYLHHNHILHRDIKGSNILVDLDGNLKLADFGLARQVDLSNTEAHYTNRVITLWYRPPELLLGATKYSGAVDVWGTGCLLAEMFKKTAVFQGKDEVEQLRAIYDVMGTPTIEEWPELLELPWYQMLAPENAQPSQFTQVFGPIMPTAQALDLLSQLLVVNPHHRISAAKALEHAYFSEDPAPQAPNLREIGEWHDLEAKKKRHRDREERRKRQQDVRKGDELREASVPTSGPTSAASISETRDLAIK